MTAGLDPCYECGWWPDWRQCHRCGQLYRLAPVDAPATGTGNRNVIIPVIRVEP